IIGLWSGCGLSEIRDETRALRALLSTNAPLSAVESTLKTHYDIRLRGTGVWDRMMSKYSSSGSRQDQIIAGKLRKCEAAGHASSQSMQTWVFLDTNDRLIDF